MGADMNHVPYPPHVSGGKNKSLCAQGTPISHSSLVSLLEQTPLTGWVFWEILHSSPNMVVTGDREGQIQRSKKCKLKATETLRWFCILIL